MFAQKVSMLLAMDDGDDLPPLRQRRAPSGFRNVKKYREIQNENVEEHDRIPGGSKIADSRTHRDLARRVDTWWAIKALGRTKADFTNAQGHVGKEWFVFLAMEYGWVTDAKGILRPHKGKQEAKERDLSFEEVADYYGLTRYTVEQYDREARRKYRDHAAIIRAEGPGPDDDER